MELRHAAAIATLAAVCFSVSVTGQPSLPKPAPGEVNAHFVNVGQGAAVLLEFDCGAALIDTGGEKNAGFDSTTQLREYLDAFFRRRSDLNRSLNMVVVSHAHIDHTRGLSTVMSRYKVKVLVDNGLEKGSGGRQQKAAHRAVKESGGLITHMAVKERDTDESLGPPAGTFSCSSQPPEFRFLWGSLNARDGWSKEVFENGNNSSVVTRLVVGSATWLFPGDLEEEIQEDLIAERCPAGAKSCPLDVDFYHVSHHGSHNGTSEDLLKTMTPRVAIISMGPFDRNGTFSAHAFGHPRTTIINRLLTGPNRVSGARTPPVLVKVANKSASSSAPGPQFSDVSIGKAIYGTGWQTDQTLVFVVKKNGTFSVVPRAK